MYGVIKRKPPSAGGLTYCSDQSVTYTPLSCFKDLCVIWLTHKGMVLCQFAARLSELMAVFTEAFSGKIGLHCSHYPPNYCSRSLWHNQQSPTSFLWAGRKSK